MGGQTTKAKVSSTICHHGHASRIIGWEERLLNREQAILASPKLRNEPRRFRGSEALYRIYMERVKSFFSGRAGRRSKPDCTAPLAAMRSPRPNPYEA